MGSLVLVSIGIVQIDPQSFLPALALRDELSALIEKAS